MSPRVPMLLHLLLIAAFWLGIGFVAGLGIWVGLLVRRATLRRRRPVVDAGTVRAGEARDRGFAAGGQDAGTIHPAQGEGSGGAAWGPSAPVRRESAGRELLSFPK